MTHSTKPLESDCDKTVDSPDRPWEELRRIHESGEPGEVEAFLAQLSTHDQALALSRLADGTDALVIEEIGVEEAADVLSHLPETEAARVLGHLSPDAAAAIVHEMPSDEQADLIGDLPASQAAAILDSLPADEAEVVRELTSYDDDVAGGMMVREMLVFTPDMTIAEVISHLNDNADTYSDFDVQYAYVCDRSDRLVGVLPMRDLLFAKRSRSLGDPMIDSPLSVFDTASLEELADFFDTHNFLGVPVVDQLGTLKGVLRRAAVHYEETRAAESDYLKSQGIVGGEELRTMPLWLRSKRRLSWLTINIVLNIGAAAVIAYFQETLQSVIALAVFLPIIGDMSGCSGNQPVAVSMRELSLGLVRPHEMFRVWWQEVSVGLINGAALGLLVALVASVFEGNVY